MEKEQLLKIPLGLINHMHLGEVIIIDVRTPMEFVHGHIQGALNVPFESKEAFLKDACYSDKPIVICSAGDDRSSLFCKYLDNKGVQAVDGGHWEDLKKVIEE